MKSSNWNKINEEPGQPPTTSQSLWTLRFYESFSSLNNSASTVTSKLTATFPSRFLFYALHHVPGYSTQSRLIFCHQLMLLNVRHLIKLKGRKVLNNLFYQPISPWEGLGKIHCFIDWIRRGNFLTSFWNDFRDHSYIWNLYLFVYTMYLGIFIKCNSMHTLVYISCELYLIAKWFWKSKCLQAKESLLKRAVGMSQ